MSLSKTYRVGLVGCGGMGLAHLNTLKQMPGFEISAICDISPEALKKTGEEYKIQAHYQDFEKMYDEIHPDIVVVATQTRGHLKPTVAALSRGISVLCEKPIAIDLVEADQMVAAAARSDAKLAINQQNHVNAGIRKAQAMVVEMIQEEGVLESGLFKSRIDSTRKYALAFLDYLDGLRITVRIGNDRKLSREYEKNLL